MSKSNNIRDRADHLRSGLIFLVVWIGVVIIAVRVFKDSDVLQTILKFREGDFTPLLLVCTSMVLLAMVIRSFFLYFQGGS